jgi:putative cardiolipin synthase
MLASELLLAAERGVRVRILLDDMDAQHKHELFAVVDQHPNLDVRYFNPFYDRSGALANAPDWLLRAGRLSRRMHNKAWIADNRVAIIGGRNIGDEYFGAAEHMNFSDLDLLMTGPIVQDVSRSFDEYWNSRHAVPVDRFDHDPPEPGALAKLVEAAREFQRTAGDDPYIAALRDPVRREEMLADRAPALHVDDIRLLVDDPDKIGSSGNGPEASIVLTGIASIPANREILIFSPYFVPGEAGANGLIEAVKRGVRVAVLTNSLAATDVAAVHTGYARYRERLLKGGVELYEMKRKLASVPGRRQISVTGSTTASLHTKAMVIDARWSFVGSMNLDPRSANLNTEMGALVDSPELAAQLRELFQRSISPELSYRVTYERGEGLVWYDRAKGRERRHDDEPDASIGRRLATTLLRLVPIESQL